MRPRTPVAPAAFFAPAGLVVLFALGLSPAGADAARLTDPAADPAADTVRDTARFEFAEPHMGTAFRVVLFADDSAEAAAAAEAAFAVIADLDARLSDWDPDSELSRLSEVAGTAEGREVSPELWGALSLARAWAERSDGAFDPTVGPLSRLWRWSARRGELPDSARLARARAAVGWRHLRLEGGGDDRAVRPAAPARPEHEQDASEARAASARRVVYLDRPGMALDLGGIAKGIAADAALSELTRRGFPGSLVDAGGDLALGDPPPGAEGWRVAVGSVEVEGEAAAGTVVLANVGVASSGDRYRYLEVDGVRYSHILDPRTGLGVRGPRTVTVIAPDAATADVLASALSVMEAEAGRALVASVPGARIPSFW